MPTEPKSKLGDSKDAALESWKEIAGFFAVTPRTVQNWEEERGLPVHRVPGPRGRVYAHPVELRAWKESHAGKAAAPPKQPLLPPARRSARTSRWAWAACLTVIGALLSWAFLSTPRTPSAWRVDGRILIVSDERGRELWRYRFDTPPDLERLNLADYSQPLFSDLDGDGRVEFLFPSAAPLHSAEGEELFCFSSKGQVLLRYRPGHPVHSRRQTFDAGFRVRRFALVPGPGYNHTRLLVVGTHRTDYPSHVTLLELNGRILRDYWHSGHIIAALPTDLDNDGRTEIYLAGISNANHCATLVALDSESFEGASAERDEDFQLLDMSPPKELGRILLNRTILNQRLETHNISAKLQRLGDRLVVTAMESPSLREEAAQYFTFGPRLRLLDITFGDANFAVNKQSHTRGLLRATDPKIELAALRDVRYLTPWPGGGRKPE